MEEVTLAELLPEGWERLRRLRITSLSESPDAFGGNLETEEMLSEEEWRKKFEKLVHLVAVIDGIDIAVLSVENLEGDFGATCWIGGCWVNPEYRGRGVMKALISYLDEHAEERGWKVQGLGVFSDNDEAIAAYEKLGFIRRGELQPSTRRPDRLFQRMIRDPR
jgi:RimJ/RimL family protein N-acetyltransferase